MRRYYLMVFLLFSRVSNSIAQTARRNYDIVIAGAGTGGTAAALSAARMGADVALLEETDWIGGQPSAAAVSTMDEGSSPIPPSGIYREFLARIEA
jgi:NADPH-dependent 2,4-dienoyl-CoA reductase/sulfur reductase-like enzyme